MTREIKFRAWDKAEKKMIYDFSFSEKVGGETGEYDSCLLSNGELSVVDEDGNECEIMQFTGLKDKNGKEIYEGDIVEWFGQDGEYVGTGEIVWNVEEVCFEISNKVTSEIIDEAIYMKIIGNKFENPELLK